MKLAYGGLLLFAMVLSCFTPVFPAQQPYSYTVFVDIYSFPWRPDSVSISLTNQFGRIVATASSPFGAQVEVTFGTATPITYLTAIASGRMSPGSCCDQYARIVSGRTTILVGSDQLVYWISVFMR